MKLSLKLNLDKIGICASTVCGLHCLLTPFILLALPFASLAFLASEGFEIGLLILSFLLAIASLVVSYFRKHFNVMPTILAGVGFLLFMIGKAIPLEIAEIILSVAGGVFIVLAHYRNIKLTKQIAVK
ncbi:MAG: MerC domain-containing protein [Cyclobacteriaceae bacterium]|nr:MerC domain-containing protein [Cyclobacteriaceae bacterium HetDA_MAG_MS6]